MSSLVLLTPICMYGLDVLIFSLARSVDFAFSKDYPFLSLSEGARVHHQRTNLGVGMVTGEGGS